MKFMLFILQTFFVLACLYALMAWLFPEDNPDYPRCYEDETLVAFNFNNDTEDFEFRCVPIDEIWGVD